MSHVFLVSGASRGLGRAITEAALEAGHRVVAGVRSASALTGLADRKPDHDAAVATVAAAARPGDLVLTLGAGDVTRLGPQVLARLGEDAR